MPKYRLFAPGPTPVPEEVLLAMASPIIHHRTPTFQKVLEEVREGLKWLFQTKNEVLILASSGTGGMEGAVTNTLSPGDKAIVVDSGKFGERWAKICKAYGVEADVIKVEWGCAVDPKIIEEKLKKGGYRAVLIQASETSTGVYHPVKEIAEIVSKYPDTISIVDAISALGAMPLPFDEWKIDVMVAGAQKGLMLPPGLAFVALSDKAWKFAEASKCPKFYFNFKVENKKLAENQTNYTPAVTLIIGLARSLKMMKEEGLEKMFARHARLAEATRKAVEGMGLKLFAKSPSNSVTAVCAPDSVDGQKIVKILKEKINMTIAGGQDQAKGKIFRIAHLGYVDESDQLAVLAAVEKALAELGYPVKKGQGIAAAMEVFT